MSSPAATLSPLDLPPGCVLGIDPGSHKLGWGIVAPQGTGLRYVASGCIVPGGNLGLPERLGRIYDQLVLLFHRYPCRALAVESAFLHENPRTALVLGQARGLPVALAASRGMPVHEYPPALVKRRVVGSGRAEKSQMRAMIQLLLALPEAPGEDEADALAVAIAHLRAHAFSEQVGAADSSTPAQALWLAQLHASKARR